MTASPTSAAPRSGRNAHGWSFIDIMVALAVLAILLAIAAPTYRQYVQRAHRAEAVGELLRAAACQERVRAATGSYDLTRCARNPPGNRYRIVLEPVGVSTSPVFEAIAQPTGPGPSDACGDLRIDHAGTRTIGGDASLLDECWSAR